MRVVPTKNWFDNDSAISCLHGHCHFLGVAPMTGHFLRIRVALNHPLGYDKIQANLAYQICDNRICAPLQTQILATPIIVQSDS